VERTCGGRRVAFQVTPGLGSAPPVLQVLGSIDVDGRRRSTIQPAPLPAVTAGAAAESRGVQRNAPAVHRQRRRSG